MTANTTKACQTLACPAHLFRQMARFVAEPGRLSASTAAAAAAIAPDQNSIANVLFFMIAAPTPSRASRADR
ncbi:hypothetical protein [Sphingomonas sp. PAMC 26605]|uniref:hypothetical protein n=1 Tax=Sphingomonas sp. PAMC 26605 TaxID=1112214 RepID=UPI0018DED51F|nr:hypothetical protein [Sphingomonas sp. PAMC 26605]